MAPYAGRDISMLQFYFERRPREKKRNNGEEDGSGITLLASTLAIEYSFGKERFIFVAFLSGVAEGNGDWQGSGVHQDCGKWSFVLYGKGWSYICLEAE